MAKNGSEITVKVKYKDEVVNELDIDAKMSYKSVDVENQEKEERKGKERPDKTEEKRRQDKTRQ